MTTTRKASTSKRATPKPEPTLVERLTSLRDRLEGLIAAEQDGSKLAALSREYRTVLTELEKLGAGKGASAVDDIAARREAKRRSASKAPRSSSVRR